MKFKESFLGLAIACLFITSTFAATVTTVDDEPTDSKAITEIRSFINHIKFDLEDLDQQSVKVHFMVNTANEIVVLRTNNQSVDSTIKRGLNYKELKSRDLEVNRVYILPISFEVDL